MYSPIITNITVSNFTVVLSDESSISCKPCLRLFNIHTDVMNPVCKKRVFMVNFYCGDFNIQGAYRMKKTGIIIFLICMCVLCITACSGKSTATSDAPPPISPFEPLTEIKEDRSDVYLIVKVVDSSYWQGIINGVRDAGVARECNVYCGGTTIETDWPGQHNLIEEALLRGADAIILSPDDSVELVPDIERIHNAGIPIILIDTAANTESFDFCYMTDNLLAGQRAASEMIRQLLNTGHDRDSELSVGIMIGTAASQTINERLAGFYKYWTENAPRKWKILSDIMNCKGDMDYGHELAVDFLKNHPDVAGLYSTNNGPTKVVCSVIKEEFRPEIVIVGFDYSDEMKELIESPGYNASTMLQRQYDMGSRAVDMALQILNGTTPPIKFVDTGIVTVNRDTLSDPGIVEVLNRN